MFFSINPLYIFFGTPAIPKVNISPDALRMRTRRLCERKPSGKCYVDEKVAEEFKNGGESREVLEMALLESLARYGTKRCAYKRIKAWFGNVIYIYMMYMMYIYI